MGNQVEGKVALITGATQGIGEGIARSLAAEGAAIVVSGIDAPNGTRVVEEINSQGGRARFVAADVRDARECNNAIRESVHHYGRLDVLVNNAGIFPSSALEDCTSDLWDDVFAVNARGAFLCCRAAIPEMLQQGGGSIINIGSTLAYGSDADRFAYSASKGALLSLTKSMAKAYARQKIRSNWITVGWVASPGEIDLRQKLHGDGPLFLERQATNLPLGRMERAEDIAAGVIFLASDAASHVTGCELNLSGGLHI